METGGRGERKIVEPASSKQQRLKSRCALAYSLGIGMVAYKTRQKPASRCSLPEHIEEATFYLASVLVVEWLATFNQKRKVEQGKGERSCPLFSGSGMDGTNQKCKSRKRSRETDRSATTRTRVGGALSVSYHSCSGKDPQLSKGPPTARITVANPPFTQWIALILFQSTK
ncbi:hypothetical protein V6N11_014020 [Hibiscus sabdariffa]|uniref:Uncharacterized protein n=2 Tax=Hibiscus sabdariffa TaxID=183260 RepID=A0ABR2AFH9_9ROSI